MHGGHVRVFGRMPAARFPDGLAMSFAFDQRSKQFHFFGPAQSTIALQWLALLSAVRVSRRFVPAPRAFAKLPA
jgi:hypothetical protein